MNRRTFLSLSAATVAASALPLPARRAWSAEGAPGIEVLNPAFEKAREAGKSLLVILVPDSPEERWARGGAFGDLFLVGDDTILADLAMVDVVCARTDLVRYYTDWLGWSDKCQMALVETAIEEPSQPCAGAPLPAPLVPYGSDGTDLASSSAQPEVRARRLGALAQNLIARNDEMVKRRASQNYQAIGKGFAQSVIKAVEKGRKLPPEKVDRAAAVLAWHAVSASDELRQRIIQLLANAARARLVHDAPPGSRWVIPATEGEEAHPGPSGPVPYLEFVAPKASDADDGKKKKKKGDASD